jgi:hypothetical protein
MRFKIFSLGMFLLLTVCHSVYAGELDGAKYKISTFKLDLAESVTYAQFLKEDEFSYVVRDSMELMLKRVNKLAADGDAQPVNLDIYVDYYRRFVGDASPWPIASLAPPNFFITIKAERDGKEVFLIKTRELVNLTGGYDFLQANKPDFYKKDYFRAYELAAEMVSYIANKAKDFSPPRAQELADLSVRAEFYHSRFGTPNNQTADFYVPDDAAEPYIVAIMDANRKVRINNFNAITREWIFNEKLVLAVRAHVEKLLQSSIDKDTEKELRYAMNALASFGLLEDLAVFEKIKNTSGYSKDVYKEVEDSNNILKKRNDQNLVVHNFETDPGDQTWEVKQLVNRLALADVKDLLQAISRVKRSYPREPIILNTMKTRLEKEALVFNYKARMYSEVDAHFCRVIGNSGNPEYLEFLEMMAKNAFMDYTREHCQAGWEVLRSLNKELVKKQDEERKQQQKLAKEKAKQEKKLKNKEK